MNFYNENGAYNMNDLTSVIYGRKQRKREYDIYKKNGGKETYHEFYLRRGNTEFRGDYEIDSYGQRISRIDKPNANNLKNKKDKKITNHYMKFREGYYDAINDMEITDVFQNFENKYGKDDTTELTTFKDMNQKDAFPPHGKDRANLFKAVHERDKNIGVESKVFSHKNYLKEEELFVDMDNYILNESPFNEKGYKKYVAKCERKGIRPLKFEAWKLKNGITTAGTLATTPLGGVVTHAIANSALRNNEKNLAESLFIEGYLAALDEACSCGSKKCPICSKKKKVMNDCGISCNEEDEIFLQGYYDAIEECGDCCGEECCDGEETTLKKKVIDSVDGEANKISQPDANGLAVDAYDYDEPIDNHYMAFEEGYTDALLELL